MKARLMLVAGAVLAASLSVAGVSTANASLSQCHSGSICMWASNDFVTLIGHRAGGNGLLNLSGDANNAMDSWGNLSTVYNGAGYDKAGGSGDCQTFGKDKNDNNVNPFNSDEISAWKTNAGC